MEKLLEKHDFTSDQKRDFTFEMARLYLQTENGNRDGSFARDLYAHLRNITGNVDLFREIKKASNDLVLGMYAEMKAMIRTYSDPIDTALRLAIAGNIIDYAINDQFDLMATVNRVLKSDFSINHSAELRRSIENAETVLYLGDNCGELVFDKLLIETLAHPNIYYAVRDAPVINDATIEDAQYVGIDQFAKVISNGYDAPSTLINHCSEEFLEVFNRADVIVSKGQGNLEGLFNCLNPKIFFLLMVKCDVVAERLGVKKGGFVVKQQFAE